jgi:hypothetical protein
VTLTLPATDVNLILAAVYAYESDLIGKGLVNFAANMDRIAGAVKAQRDGAVTA